MEETLRSKLHELLTEFLGGVDRWIENGYVVTYSLYEEPTVIRKATPKEMELQRIIFLLDEEFKECKPKETIPVTVKFDDRELTFELEKNPIGIDEVIDIEDGKWYVKKNSKED